jgi:Flp pilus assembly protein TadG
VTRRRQQGQSLVEFAMIIPLFLVLVLSVFEFAFMFNALLSIGHATRDAALIAAEAGNAGSADCVTLRAIEDDVTAPTSKNRITQVLIYRSDANGTVKNSNTYTRGGSTSCTMADGSTLTVPYTATAVGYPATSRCNIVAGCPIGAPTQTLDTIGVRITYSHNWVTPLANFIGGGGGTTTIVQSNTMRMEPVL